MDQDAPDAGMARAGAAAAARREELGISQRELARQKVITASVLIDFEKGRAWPRERTRHTLEQVLQWPAGAIARIRAGADVSEATRISSDDSGGIPPVVDAVQMALASLDNQIVALPVPTAPDFPARAAVILADLRKLKSITARAARYNPGSPAMIKILGLVHRRYDQLMLSAAATPSATLGQRLYAARQRADLTAAQVAVAAALDSTEIVEAIENGQAPDPATAQQIEALITDLTQ